MAKKTITEKIMINGRVYKKSFSRLSDALGWKEKMREDRKLFKMGVIRAVGGIDFSELCLEYLETRVGTKETTRETYACVIKNHLCPAMGTMKVKNLKKADGIKLISKLERDKKAQTTINKILVILKCIIKFAVENDYIEVNPFSSIKPMKVDLRKFDYWNEKEAQIFLKSIEKHPLFNLFKFALNTGLRRGELCGLQWRNVKVSSGQMELHFNEQLLPGRRRDLVKGHSSRFVPLTKQAVEVLESIGRKEDHEYIFQTEKGLSIEPSTLSIDFKKIQYQAGIKKVIKLHALRHSFASLLTAKGINIQKVQHLMGHKDSKVTERYSHLSQAELGEAVQVVNFDL